MSFNSTMHGTPFSPQPFIGFGSMNDSISEETAKKIASLQVKLDRKLGPEYISQRPGPGGGPKLTYVEGWKVINLANEVFGFNGWSSSVVSLTTDFADYIEETKRYCIGVTAIVRVTLKDGVFHEDIGYGMLENSKSKGAALDKCKKEAVTDGLKRALRNFGNLLGNCLYDKSYTAEIVKVKVEPPKFNKDQLHRPAQFEDVKIPTAPKIPNANTSYTTPTRLPMHQNKPVNASHLRSEVQPGTTASTSTTNKPNPTNRIPQHIAQPITPVTTPLHNQHQPQQEKRVSFAKPAVPSAAGTTSSVTPKQESDTESDDSYGFNAEEFRSLAALDADVGRPIGEGDLGRPIDYDEGMVSDTSTLLDQQQSLPREPVPQPQPQQRTINTRRSLSREAAIAAALQAHAEETERKATEATKSPRVSTGAPGPSPMPPPTTNISTTSKILTDSNRPTVVQEQVKATSLSYQRYQQYVKEHQKNQTSEPKQSDRQQSSSALSMGGGFIFPPGTSLISPPLIGVKRPADSMSASSTTPASSLASFKGARPGMGLQNINPTHKHIPAPLEVGEGGDPKRLRR